MTELNTTSLMPPAASPEMEPAAVPLNAPPISYTRKIIRITFARLSARIGLAWIAVMVVVAIFAPFLANSRPYLICENGHWSSPLLRTLTAADVVLQIAFWSAVVLFFCRWWRGSTRLWIFLAVLVVGMIVATETIMPPELIVYQRYRDDLKHKIISRVYYPPIHYSPDDHQRDEESARLNRPTHRHAMGTTADAADLASNMIYAARIALSIGFVATSVAVVLGTIMGGIMGYFGGTIDLIGMRIVEIFESIPAILLLLAFAAQFQQSSEIALYIMMVVIGVLNSFSYAEFVRAEFLSLRDRDFVHAARAAGLRTRSILFRHMLPNGMTPIIVNASFGVAGAILIESTLSFLHIGLQTEASWGNLLSQALGDGGSFFWWLALYPGLGIFLTVFAYNLVGESLRDALDPKLNKME